MDKNELPNKTDQHNIKLYRDNDDKESIIIKVRKDENGNIKIKSNNKQRAIAEEIE